MQTILDEAPPAEAAPPETAPERKLTKEELFDLVGAYATKGDHLTRAEREVYAWQLVKMLHPDKPLAQRCMVALMSRPAAERQADADAAARRASPARQPPPGKTWQDMVIGKWPGDETDEEINAWLEEIS